MTAAARCVFTAALLCAAAQAQVFSPHVMRAGGIDTRTVQSLAKSICERAGARTDREKAEAIWRFFLTDGRFVKPGFWYHIAGWAYEEPQGEVLDPLKLANSYGFGLCYHVAPLLEAVWKAAGFTGARTWFLTGHTVAEVFYNGAYHHYDSDMMGYTTSEKGDFRRLPVASVRQLERDGGIILRNLRSPREADPATVDRPWYPADLREAAMGGLARLFTTARDNYLFPYTRTPQGHTMDFVLRPGERMVRWFRPERPGAFYLPFAHGGAGWREFPREIAQYNIRTEDGPHSQKDARLWATGLIEYRPAIGGLPAQAVFEMPSPYVIIDASAALNATLRTPADGVAIETSADGGRTWDRAGELRGPHSGRWETGAAIKARGEHGNLTAVSGTYHYLLRLTRTGTATVDDLAITTRFQVNPRALPGLEPGRNEMVYSAGASERRYPVYPDLARAAGARWVAGQGQGFLAPAGADAAELILEVAAPDGAALTGFDAGARFLDLRDGLAPDKFTAEVRKTAWRGAGTPSASLAWSTAPGGPFTTLWTYDPDPRWLDGDRIDRLLRWPEVDRSVRALPAGTKKAYVRYRIAGMAIDGVRLAAIAPAAARASRLEVTHIWREGGRERTHTERIANPAAPHRYNVETAGPVTNEAVVFSCPK